MEVQKNSPCGSNWFSYGLLSFVTSALKIDFQFLGGNLPKISKKTFIVRMGRMDGRMDETSKLSFDFLHVNK